jgi:hypothetical protein
MFGHLTGAPANYHTRALLCLVALIAIGALLVGVQLASYSPYNWSPFVGIGAVLMLWLTPFSLSSFAVRLRQQRAR